MQSETLFSLIGKIRVQRIRLAQRPVSPIATSWTANEELKFYEVLPYTLSSSNFMEPTTPSFKPIFLNELESRSDANTMNSSKGSDAECSDWKCARTKNAARTTLTKRFSNP